MSKNDFKNRMNMPQTEKDSNLVSELVDMALTCQDPIVTYRILSGAQQLSEDIDYKTSIRQKMEELVRNHSEISEFNWRTMLMNTNIGLVTRHYEIHYPKDCNCWFCGIRRPDDNSTKTIEMHKELINKPFIVIFEAKTIKVPCCKECGSYSDAGSFWLGILIGCMIGVSITLIFGIGWYIIIGLFIGSIFGLFIGSEIAKKIEHSRGIKESESTCPIVVQAMKDDFKTGKPKPPSNLDYGIIYMEDTIIIEADLPSTAKKTKIIERYPER